MKCTFTPLSDIKPGMRTVLGAVTEIKFSPSGKTALITVRKDNGATFTDRVSALGKMAVFS